MFVSQCLPLSLSKIRAQKVFGELHRSSMGWDRGVSPHGGSPTEVSPLRPCQRQQSLLILGGRDVTNSVRHCSLRNCPYLEPIIFNGLKELVPLNSTEREEKALQFQSMFSIRHPSGVSNIMPQFHYPLKPGNNKYTKVFWSLLLLMKEINLIQNVCVESSLEMEQAPRLATNCLLDGRPHQYSILHDRLYDIVEILTPRLTAHTKAHFPLLPSPSQHS